MYQGYMKQGLAGAEKGHSLGRSQGSLYGNKEELYDRLKRHAYQPGQGKKGKCPIMLFDTNILITIPSSDKSSANETTSDSDDARQ